MRSRPVMALLGLAASLGAIACGQPVAKVSPSPPPAEATVVLTVSAAASVQDALREIQTAYQTAAPAVSLTYNFGSSGSLAQQVTQGAPTDVFLSASEQWMDELESNGQILADSRRDLLQNTMVLIVPPVVPQDKATVTAFKALATDAVTKVAIGEPNSVPAGSYAREVLTTLNLFDGLQPKLVFGKDVRQVLSYVETGNVDAGLVYGTDARVSGRVRRVATAAADTHAPIVYPVAVVQDSDQAVAAQAFVDFLASDPAIAIFESYGFAMAE